MEIYLIIGFVTFGGWYVPTNAIPQPSLEHCIYEAERVSRIAELAICSTTGDLSALRKPE